MWKSGAQRNTEKLFPPFEAWRARQRFVFCLHLTEPESIRLHQINFCSGFYSLYSLPRRCSCRSPPVVGHTSLLETARTFAATANRPPLALWCADGSHIRARAEHGASRACPATVPYIRRPEPVVVYLQHSKEREGPLERKNNLTLM